MVRVQKSLSRPERLARECLRLFPFTALCPEYRFATYEPWIIRKNVSSQLDLFLCFVELAFVQRDVWRKSIRPDVGAIHAQRPRVVFPSLRVVAAVHRGLPNEHEREGIVGLRGQSLHETRA